MKPNPKAILVLQMLIAKLPDWEPEYHFAPPRRWRFDYAWPEHRVALEFEGGVYTQGRHTRGKGFEADCEKYNAAAISGWTVIRVTASMVSSGEALKTIKQMLSKAHQDYLDADF